MNKAQVPFSEHLDLSSFIDGRSTLKYRLLAVVHHTGSLQSGHYQAVAKGPSGNWEEIEDMQVRSARVSVKNATDPAKPWSPYLLFWERIGG